MPFLLFLPPLTLELSVHGTIALRQRQRRVQLSGVAAALESAASRAKPIWTDAS